MFCITITEIDDAIYLCVASTDQGNKEDDKEPNLEELVPKEYHDFLPLFQKKMAEKLPPHRPIDHKIPLQEGK